MAEEQIEILGRRSFAGTSTLEQTVNSVNTNVQNLIKAMDKEATYRYEQLTAYSEMSKLASPLDESR